MKESFILSLPQTTNAIYHTSGGKWYKDAKAKAWEEEAKWEIYKQRKLKKPLEGYIYVNITWYFKYPRDIDGGIKPVLDIMQKAGVYMNDDQVYRLTVIKKKDKLPRCNVDVDTIDT